MRSVLSCTVNEALLWIKDAIANSRFSIIPRFKNNNGLIQLGLTKDTLETIICSLTYRNHCAGPEDDRDMPGTGEIWLYGEDINGIETYIKIKIFTVENENYAKCMSIHPAAHPMNYSNQNS